MKFKARTDHRPGIPDFYFHCPGCGCDHGVWTTDRNDQGAVWSFNGDLSRPTVSPSILVRWNQGPDQKKNICHSFIRDGRIEYLADCTHQFKGQTIDLPDYDQT